MGTDIACEIVSGTILSVDNAWRLHPYKDDEFFVQVGDDDTMWVASHSGDDKKLTIHRVA